MVEGPFRSRRFAERMQSVEGILLALSALASLVYVGFNVYELALAGAFLKVAAFVFGGSVLLAFAAWSSSPIAVLPVILFAFILGLWR